MGKLLGFAGWLAALVGTDEPVDHWDWMED
jgi:hypothetical protein